MRVHSQPLRYAASSHCSCCSARPAVVPRHASTNRRPTPRRRLSQTTTPEAAPTPRPAPTPAPPSRRVTINAVGDIMLARDLITMMDTEGSAAPYAAVRDLLADADLTIANMEGTFTERGVQQVKAYTFRTPPRHAAGLRDAGIDIVSLGNNHAADYGPRRRLRHAGGPRRGGCAARRRRHERARGAQPRAHRGQRPEDRLPLLQRRPRSHIRRAEQRRRRLRHEANVAPDVAYWKQRSDVVIVALHAGTEYTDAPNAKQLPSRAPRSMPARRWCWATIPTSCRAGSSYGNGVIVYSLGNFVFDLDADDLAPWASGPSRASSCTSSSLRPASPTSSRAPFTLTRSKTAPSPPPAIASAASRSASTASMARRRTKGGVRCFLS